MISSSLKHFNKMNTQTWICSQTRIESFLNFVRVTQLHIATHVEIE